MTEIKGGDAINDGPGSARGGNAFGAWNKGPGFKLIAFIVAAILVAAGIIAPTMLREFLAW